MERGKKHLWELTKYIYLVLINAREKNYTGAPGPGDFAPEMQKRTRNWFHINLKVLGKSVGG